MFVGLPLLASASPPLEAVLLPWRFRRGMLLWSSLLVSVLISILSSESDPVLPNADTHTLSATLSSEFMWQRAVE